MSFLDVWPANRSRMPELRPARSRSTAAWMGPWLRLCALTFENCE